jgi:uncharacterized repeat protein (TIGR03803 family)
MFCKQSGPIDTRVLKILAATFALCAAADNLNAQVTLTAFYAFSNSSDSTNGSNPAAGLLQGSDGSFFGTTSTGGAGLSVGTVFRISPSGSLTTLYSFNSHSNGYSPGAALMQGNDGNFYGTTTEAGTNNSGTVFQITPSGGLKTLHTFGSFVGDGSKPVAGLVQGNDGNFYGTTSVGGTNDNGTVFQITSSGTLTILHVFGSFLGDGSEPAAGLVQGNDGNFYGTTSGGGANGAGTVFQWNTNGILTILHSFSSHPDGANPEASLVQGSDGNLYGTTAGGGGVPGGGGTVFRISPSGNYTNLHSFNGNDGSSPGTGLVQGSDGNFYGTTPAPGFGPGVYGSFFRITPSGTLTNLYTFNSTDGSNPSGLVQGSDGNFYGTTSGLGTNGGGTVFQLVVPLNSPPNQISAIHIAGTNVFVTIPSIAGEFYQLQYRNSLTSDLWSNVAGAVATSIGGSLMVTDLGGASSAERFYRFAITP